MKKKDTQISLKNTDELVKAGMLSTMGAAVYSGFAGGKLARFIHPWAGIAMVFFSLWHYQINTRKKSKALKKSTAGK